MKKSVLFKSFISSILLMLVTCCLLVASTFAWFTDSVSNTGNRIQAGTLDVGLDQYIDGQWQSIASNSEPIFNNDILWEPGYSCFKAFRITNEESNLALEYRLYLIDDTLVVKNTKIYEAIDVYSVIVDKDTAEYAINNITSFDEFIASVDNSKLVKKNLKELFDDADNFDYKTDGVDYYNYKDGIIHGVILPQDSDITGIDGAAKEEAYALIVLHMQEDAGNEYQGLQGIFNIELRASQFNYEKDGFDTSDYDIDAEFGSISCVANGTMITLADGSKKAVEEITYDDELLTYNFISGQLEGHKCYLIQKHNNVDSTVITLEFANGDELVVVDAQCIFDLSLMEYAYISEDCADWYLGDSILFIKNGEITQSELVNFTIEHKKVDSVELCTNRTMNFIANNVLSVEPSSYGLCVYEVGEDLKVSAENLAALVAEYGLYTYADFPNITPETFDKMGLAYFKIIMEYYGVDVDYLRSYYNQYGIR